MGNGASTITSSTVSMLSDSSLSPNNTLDNTLINNVTPTTTTKDFVPIESDEIFPIADLATKMRAYQHSVNGEIIVLVGHNINDVVGSPQEWDEMIMSSTQLSYFNRIQLRTEVNTNTNVESSTFATQSNNSNSNSQIKVSNSLAENKSSSTSTRREEMSKSPTDKDIDEHLEQRDDYSNGIVLAAIDTSFAQPKLNLPLPQILSTQQLHRKHLEALADNANTNDSTSFAKSGAKTNDILFYPPPSASSIESNDVETFEDEINEFFDYDLDILNTVEEKEYFKTESNTSLPICRFCMTEVLSNHGDICPENAEISKEFSNIDELLQTYLSTVNQFNASHMETALMKALKTFELRSKYSHAILRLARSVSNIRCSDEDLRCFDVLQQQIEECLVVLLRKRIDNKSIVCTGGVAGALDENEIGKLCYMLEDLSNWLKRKRSLLRGYRMYSLNSMDFRFIRTLSSGSFSTVYLAQRIDTKQYCAIKVMEKNDIRQKNMVDRIFKEMIVMKRSCLMFPEVFTKLYCSFHSCSFLFLVMEFHQVTKRVEATAELHC